MTATAPRRVAFVLSQLGTTTAKMFAELTRPMQLRPSDAGVLRLLAQHPGLSQRALADRLGAVPSRVVALIDSLEQRGLVARTRSVTDRRHHQLALTEAGREVMRDLRGAAAQLEAQVTATLDATERDQLAILLHKLAGGLGLDPDVHPGYSSGENHP